MLLFTCNFFAYFKFHSGWGRVIGKIKQNEQDCRDTAPLMSPLSYGFFQEFWWKTISFVHAI